MRRLMAIVFALYTFALFFGQVCTGAGDEFINKTRVNGRQRRQIFGEAGKSFKKISPSGSAGIQNKLAKLLQEKLDRQRQPSNMWDSRSEGVQPKSNLTHKVCSSFVLCWPFVNIRRDLQQSE